MAKKKGAEETAKGVGTHPVKYIRFRLRDSLARTIPARSQIRANAI